MNPELNNETKAQDFFFVQSMSKYIVQFFERIKDLKDDDVDLKLVGNEADDEKKELIQAMCEDVDLYYKRLNEMRSSGLTPGKWYEREIENCVEEVYPGVTPEEVDEVKKTIASAIDDEIIISTEVLADEIDPTKDIANRLT